MAETVLGDLYLIYLHKIATIRWIIEKAREFQKNVYFCFIGYAKDFVWITANCGIFLKRWEYQITLPDHKESQE